MPILETKIPYVSSGALGEEYNRLMSEAKTDWVLFLDHDVLLCNPHWYQICKKAIEQFPDAGMFTCYTNAISCKYQKTKAPSSKASIWEHLKFGEEVFNKGGFWCTPVGVISGFFMLVSKKAWEDVGGFPANGFFKEDRGFSGRLLKKKYRIMRMNGLYVYHVYKDKPKFEVEGSKLSDYFK